jgi:hypothetical protein
MNVVAFRRALQSAAAHLTVAAGQKRDARAAEMRELAARLQALSVQDFSELARAAPTQPSFRSKDGAAGA